MDNLINRLENDVAALYLMHEDKLGDDVAEAVKAIKRAREYEMRMREAAIKNCAEILKSVAETELSQ